MPPPDPAYPPGANSIKREGAIRLYGFLVFLDYMSATTRFKSYLLDPLQCESILSPCGIQDSRSSLYSQAQLQLSVISTSINSRRRIGASLSNRGTSTRMVLLNGRNGESLKRKSELLVSGSPRSLSNFFVLTALVKLSLDSFFSPQPFPTKQFSNSTPSSEKFFARSLSLCRSKERL